jgi:hypothetical protein
MGDAIAGFGIHKLGDIYAHGGYHTGIGHLVDGHTPDAFYTNPAHRNQYLYELAGLLADGVGASSTRQSAIADTQRVRKFASDSLSGDLDGYDARFIGNARNVLDRALPGSARFNMALLNSEWVTPGAG